MVFPRRQLFGVRSKVAKPASANPLRSKVAEPSRLWANSLRSHGSPINKTFLLTLWAASSLCASAAPLGLFSNQSDIGNPKHPGSAHFDPARKAYTLTGGGHNMWFTNDAFHFLWKQASGDLSISANIEVPPSPGDPHRKACLLIRQSLEADSAYADAVVHGDGLTSLQYRETKGGPTREIQWNGKSPRRLRLEKNGDYVAMSLAGPGEPLRPAGGSFRIRFAEPFYIGLAVCAHNNERLETARFTDVEITTLKLDPTAKPQLESTLEIVDIGSKDRRAIYHARDHFEAPNWSKDGQYLLINSRGRLFRSLLTGGSLQPVDTAFAIKCNNDHGFSPDGQLLAISDQSENGKSIIYVLPAAGGTPRKVTEKSPSYWHGWSPDGKTLVYCAERNGEFDVYSIPAEGGAEMRLTAAPGLDDGPEYSPDGQWIYFNSVRSGLMQIWRMRPDGSGQEQITNDPWNNWFPHPSPDGKWIVFLSYEKEIKDHPPNKDVMLRLRSVQTGEIQILAKLFGGQGTLNVPSWSPDSRKVAFVSYRLAPPD